MAVFEDVKLTWREEERTIPADQMLRTIARVEDVMSLGQLYTALEREAIPVAKLAMAYGIMLRTAGFRVTDEDVYAGMFEDSGTSLKRRAFEALSVLMAFMVPPEQLRKSGEASGKERAAKPKGGASSPSASSSSAGKAG